MAPTRCSVFNLQADLPYFNNVLPSGIVGNGVTSLALAFGGRLHPKATVPRLKIELADLYDAEKIPGTIFVCQRAQATLDHIRLSATRSFNPRHSNPQPCLIERFSFTGLRWLRASPAHNSRNN